MQASNESSGSLGIGKTITNIDLDIQEIYEAEQFQPRPNSKIKSLFRGSKDSKKAKKDLRYSTSYGDNFSRPLSSLKGPSQKSSYGSRTSLTSSIYLDSIKVKSY